MAGGLLAAHFFERRNKMSTITFCGIKITIRILKSWRNNGDLHLLAYGHTDAKKIREEVTNKLLEETHNPDGRCWCIDCRMGGGDLSMTECVRHKANDKAYYNVYEYITGSGGSLYRLKVMDDGMVDVYIEGCSRSLLSGGEYAALVMDEDEIVKMSAK
jgi:hypothetical protein